MLQADIHHQSLLNRATFISRVVARGGGGGCTIHWSTGNPANTYRYHNVFKSCGLVMLQNNVVIMFVMITFLSEAILKQRCNNIIITILS